MLLLSIVGVILCYHYEAGLNVSPSRYTEFEPSCYWILNHGWEKQKILSDLPTIEKYFLESKKVGKNFERVYICSDIYKAIIDKGPTLDSTTDFLVLNMEFNIILTRDWGQYKSFTKYTDKINNNAHLHKIYSDKVVWIMKPR